MQNDAKHKKPTLLEFVKMMEAFRNRMPRSRYPSTQEYVAQLMDVGLGMNSGDGKDLVIVILGTLAMITTSQVEDTDTYMNLLKNETAMRALYNQDYASMGEFIDMLGQRAKLADTSKADTFKEVTTKILKKHFKEEEEPTIRGQRPSWLAVRETEPTAAPAAAAADTSDQSQTDTLG